MFYLFNLAIQVKGQKLELVRIVLNSTSVYFFQHLNSSFYRLFQFYLNSFAVLNIPLEETYKNLIFQEQIYIYQLIQMGGTSNKEQQHQELANETTIEDIHQLQQARLVSDRLYQVTQHIYQHCLKQEFDLLSKAFQILTYDMPTMNLPICLKKSKKYYVCKTCMNFQVYICQNCFEVQKHMIHNYVHVQTEFARTCYCGNTQIAKNTLNCKNHPHSQAIIDQLTAQLFKSQMKYLFRIALPVTENNPNLAIPQTFKTAITFSLLYFIKEKLNENNWAASLLEEIIFENCWNQSQTVVEDKDLTVLQEIILASKAQKNLGLIADIINIIVRSSAKKENLTHLYFKSIFSNKQENKSILRVLKASYFNPSNFPQTFENYFLKSDRLLFHMQSLNSESLNDVWQKYEMFANQLRQIFSHKNHKKILSKIFQQTKFSELLNLQRYSLVNNQANSNINKIDIIFSLLSFRIVRILAQVEGGRQKLIINLKDIYESIVPKRSITFNRSLQRTFALIVCLLFQFKIPTKNQLQALLGTHVETAVAIKLIITSIDFKNSFTSQYRELIIQGDISRFEHKIQFPVAQIIAADQFFVKIFATFLSQDYIFRQYIDAKLGDILNISQLSQSNLKQPLRKLPQLFQFFEIPLQNNFSQLILSANTNQKDKECEIVLYNMLLTKENNISNKFKSIADNFITPQERVIEFIRSNAIIENKKIRTKASNNIPIILLSPDSQYIFESLQYQVIEKLVQNKINRSQSSETYNKVFNGKTLKSTLHIWQNCANVIQSAKIDLKKHEKQLIASITTLSNLYFGTKLPEIKQLLSRFINKLPSHNSKLQIYLKYIMQNKNGEEKQKEKNSQKKKQMLMALKMKQKNALQNFKAYQKSKADLEQQKSKIDLECIFCKNSIEGEPYLLGHFKYNNLYSKKILDTSFPFMQFTTCGHSAHQKCLIEMHKGDFRVWYPCILCKSITNILLPIGNAKLNEQKRLQKILDFLKNFAANYTFFFESHKQLVEFNINDITGVYKLLFKTMAYSLSIYPIANYSYFQRSQLPILKFIFDLLVFSFKKLRNLSIGGQQLDFKTNNEFANIFNYHKYQLEAYITGNEHNLTLQRKIDLHRDKIPEELTLLFDQLYEYLNDEREKIDYELKETIFRDTIKVTVLKPPQDLNDLRSRKNNCSSCSKANQQIEICVLCQWSCCTSCKDVRKIHASQNHLGDTVFVNGYNGKFTYIHQQLVGEFNSVYVDYLGHEANDKKVIQANEFTLSENGWNKIVNDIICNRLHKEIMRVNA